jgi:tetratricopeptide (TPR) repeat protein
MSHAINVLLFALCCVLIFHLLRILLREAPHWKSVSLWATLLYCVHPLHTEAVSNIKGRDEIAVMLFSCLTLWMSVLYFRQKKSQWLLLSSLVFFLALLSKENGFMFLAIVPMTIYFFHEINLKKDIFSLVSIMTALIIPAAIWWWIRKMYTQAGVTTESPEILNNPFLYVQGDERYATIFLTFLYYIKLLFIPHPLTHDYYYNQIPYVHFNDMRVIFSVVLHVFIILWAISGIKKKSVLSFAILFYFITFFIVSNLLFTVGVLMNERFLFMSSLGFCLGIAYWLVSISKKNESLQQFVSAAVIVVLILFSIKTFSRNFDWKDNLTLFLNDERWSPNSAKIQTSCGGDLTKEADKQPDSLLRKEYLQRAITHLEKALAIYPTHSNAWLLLGNARYKLNNDPLEVIPIYLRAKETRIGPYYDASFNLGCVYSSANQPQNAIDQFQQAWSIKPDIYETAFNLGDNYAKTNRGDSALLWFNKALQLNPSIPDVYYQMGKTYGRLLNNLPEAINWIKKAKEKNPKIELYYEDLGVAYGLMGQIDNVIAEMEALLKVNPQYAPAYFNLFVSWQRKGNKEKAINYLNKAKALSPAQYGNIPIPK